MAKTINYGIIVDQFFGELVSGQIQGIRPQAALAGDVHRLYLAWAEKNNLPATKSAAWFCRYFGSRHGVLSARKRYAAGTFIEGPHAVLFLAGPIHSRYGMEVELLGRQVAEFRRQADRYSESVELREQDAPLRDRVL